MVKAVAVLISDLHFTPNTLELASQALLKAQFKAVMLKVPLIICGDTLDTKAIVRAECMNALIDALSKKDAPETYILVGNHDLINEKSKEHALNFLKPYATVVEQCAIGNLPGLGNILLLPYMANKEDLLSMLQDEETPRTIICHQGVMGADMGHYVQDKTSLPPEAFADFRVISGHYHKAQDIKTGRPQKGARGLFTYVGNPYSLSFGEANDPAKGYAILMSDGLLDRVSLGLRRHHIITCTPLDLLPKEPNVLYAVSKKDDLLWLKLTGVASELKKYDKNLVAKLIGITNFKLEFIPDEGIQEEIKQEQYTEAELVDRLVDNLNDTADHKEYLKKLWRNLV